jgi:hypothetical protein
VHPLDTIIDWKDIWASKDRLEGALGAKEASGMQLTEDEMVVDRMILFGSYVFSSQTVYEHIDKYRDHKGDLLRIKAYGMYHLFGLLEEYARHEEALARSNILQESKDYFSDWMHWGRRKVVEQFAESDHHLWKLTLEFAVANKGTVLTEP